MKWVEIVMRIQVYLISHINFHYKEHGWTKSFSSQNQSINIIYPMWRTWLQCLITKRIEVIIRTQVWLIWWINFDYKENGGKKIFSWQIKAIISCIPIRRTWLYYSKTKKNGDYYENLSLTYFLDELWL